MAGSWSLSIVLRTLLSRRASLSTNLTYRGTPALARAADGAPVCVACGLCAGVCPADCIDLAAGPRGSAEPTARDLVATSFSIDLARCLMCGLCEAACPEQAVNLHGSAPTAHTEIGACRKDLADLLESSAGVL